MKFERGQLVSIPTVTVLNGDPSRYTIRLIAMALDRSMHQRSVGIVRAVHETKNGWYEVYCTHNECMVHMPKSSLRALSPGVDCEV